MDWAEWYDWEIELSAHLLKRMVDRGFSETDLRIIMDSATGFRDSASQGRFVLESTLAGASWEVVVEPDHVDNLLVVVTAYSLTGP